MCYDIFHYADSEMPAMKDLTPEERYEVQVFTAMLGCATYLLPFVVGIGLCALFLGCSTQRMTPTVTLNDSTSTYVQKHVVYVPDTVLVQLPPQKVVSITPDTLSVLFTDYATSTAAIRNGLLHHSLETTQKTLPVRVEHRETLRDSIIYRNRDVPVPVPVERVVPAKLSWWQQARIWMGNTVLVALAVCAAVWLIRRRGWWLTILRKL